MKANHPASHGWMTPAATLAGVLAIMLVRWPDRFYNPQLFAEDGTVFFLDANTMGWTSLGVPLGGYLRLTQRLGALAARPLDPLYAPLFYNGLAILMTLFVVGYIFSPRLHLPWKPLLGLAVVLVPLWPPEVYLHLCMMYWFTGILLILLLLQEDAPTTRHLVLDGTLLCVAALDGPFALMVLPLFVTRAWLRRSKPSWWLAGLVALCTTVQILVAVKFLVLTRGAPGTLESLAVDSTTMNAPFAGVGSVLVVMLRRTIFNLFFGGWFPHHLKMWILLGVTIPVLVTMIALAARLGPYRREKLWLWAFLVPYFGSVAVRARLDLWNVGDFGNSPRYFFLPMLLFLWLLIMEFASGNASARVAQAAFAIILLANFWRFRYPPPVDYHWSDYCGAIRRGEPADIPITPEGWRVNYPGQPKAQP